MAIVLDDHGLWNPHALPQSQLHIQRCQHPQANLDRTCSSVKHMHSVMAVRTWVKRAEADDPASRTQAAKTCISCPGCRRLTIF